MTSHPSRTSDHLLKKMWQTKSARFNGQVRLNRKHWMSIAATSVLSCNLVGISLYQLVFESEITPFGLKLLSVASLIVSVFLIMITLIEAARNYAGEAERMHENALKISKLYNSFQALTLAEAEQRRDEYAEAYSKLLEDAKVNHKDLDLTLFRLPNAVELGVKWPAYLLMLARTCVLLAAEYWLYFTLILGPPIGFALLLPHIEKHIETNSAQARS